MGSSLRKTLAFALIAALATSAYLAWRDAQPPSWPDWLAIGNGRIEGVEIDVATKAAGRIAEILVDEGDFVNVGDRLARMDTAVLEAEKHQADAHLQQAMIGVDVAKNVVLQRDAEKLAAVSVVAQRNAELVAASKRLARTEELVGQGIESEQLLDDHRATVEAARAAVSAAEAASAAADAAVGLAKAQVIGADSAVAAARATLERIQADLDDCVLRSPRTGRVQYRVAQPGEVVGAGGVVLNLVDLGDVYMTFFLPTSQAGKVTIGNEVRLVLDAAPEYVIPAKATFVSNVAQFTPKTVETREEREKLMFRIKAHIDPALLKQHVAKVKTGLPGLAYVRLDPAKDWPDSLALRVPE